MGFLGVLRVYNIFRRILGGGEKEFCFGKEKLGENSIKIIYFSHFFEFKCLNQNYTWEIIFWVYSKYFHSDFKFLISFSIFISYFYKISSIFSIFNF